MGSLAIWVFSRSPFWNWTKGVSSWERGVGAEKNMGVGWQKTFWRYGSKIFVVGGKQIWEYVAKHFWRWHGKIFWEVAWHIFLGSEVAKMIGWGGNIFFYPPPPHCHPLHHNGMSLVQFQHLCVTFRHLNIYVCLPNELPAFSFTCPDI